MGVKVLMILNNHYTHDPRVTAEAESLVKNGYEVKVIAWDRKNKYPLREIINDVEIIRMKLPRSLDKIIPFEILKVPIWQVLAYKKALHLYKKWKFKLVHVHDWPDLPPGVWLKRKLGVKLVYDSHEVWTYLIFTKNLPNWLNEVIWRERFLLTFVDIMLTVGREYKKYFISYFPRVFIIHNSKTGVKWVKPKTKKIKVVYIGSFNNKRCIRELVSAIVANPYSAVQAIFAGPHVQGFTEFIDRISRKDERIRYLGLIPKNQVLDETVKGNIVWFVFKSSDPLYRIGMPNKLFEAISAGRMGLAGKRTASGKFVNEYKIGLVINCDVDEINETLTYLIENPKFIIKFGKRAHRISERYNWDRESLKLLGVYDMLLG